MQFYNKSFAAILLFICASELNAQVLSATQQEAVMKTKQGSTVQLQGFLSESIPSINYKKIILPGPQFLISDDPEYIKTPEGAVLKEMVQPGAVRLYIYNVNGVKQPEKMARKITAVIKNTGTGKMCIRMLRYSSQKPSTNYYQIGKQGLADYFASVPENKARIVKPGESIAIDEKLEKNIVQYNELVHGFYEFVIDQPAEITILQTAPEVNGTEALKRITKVESSSHTNAGRGLFGVSNYKVIADTVMDTKNTAMAIVVADGEKDPWVVGIDGSRGVQAELSGNYGVMYQIEIKWKSTNGKGLALVTWNSRSGNSLWCGGMATSMIVSKGKFKEGIIQLPSDKLITTASPEAVVAQIFLPDGTGKEQTIRLTFSPPGASCLPVPLIFVPVEIKDK